MSLDDIQVDEHLNYVAQLVAVLERKMKVLRKKEIHLLKVQWQHWRDPSGLGSGSIGRDPSGLGSRRPRCKNIIHICLLQQNSMKSSRSSGGEL